MYVTFNHNNLDISDIMLIKKKQFFRLIMQQNNSKVGYLMTNAKTATYFQAMPAEIKTRDRF